MRFTFIVPKSYYLLFIGLLFLSCQNKKENYSEVILENGAINSKFLQNISPPEKALLGWYLFANGNQCDGTSTKIKCQLLKELNIDDECNPDHLNNLLQWFSNDMLAKYKLKSCPNIKVKSPIQNRFVYISLEKKGDILSINYHVMGLNTVAEKSWNMEKRDSYLISDNTFTKMEANEK